MKCCLKHPQIHWRKDPESNLHRMWHSMHALRWQIIPLHPALITLFDLLQVLLPVLRKIPYSTFALHHLHIGHVIRNEVLLQTSGAKTALRCLV